MALHYKAAFEAVKRGDRVMVTHPRPETTEKTSFGLVECGKPITAVAFRRMRENLKPVPDGLFGADMSQTYAWDGTEPAPRPSRRKATNR